MRNRKIGKVITALVGFQFVALSAQAEAEAAIRDVVYPDSEFVFVPFNTPGTVEAGCGFLGKATPVDADGDGDWDLAVAGSGYGGGARYYENSGDPFVLKKGDCEKTAFKGWRFSLADNGGYFLSN